MTTTRSATDTIDLLKSCRSVKSIQEWGNESNRRHYLNLWDAARTFRGDSTEKWYVDARGIVNHDRGQGTRSDGFLDSVQILKDFIAANEIETREVL